jgi:diguanylate cyclase (GGDEF)-like protein
MTDALTALANRRAFDQRLADEVSRARRHGTKLALLAPGTDAQGAERLAQRCVQAIAAEALPHGSSPTADHVTLSMGWALLGAVDSAASLLERADQALYAAKAAGRARAVGAAEAAAP